MSFNQEISTSGESWVYVGNVRVSTTGFNGFTWWCICNKVDVTKFPNWPFAEGLACRHRPGIKRYAA